MDGWIPTDVDGETVWVRETRDTVPAVSMTSQPDVSYTCEDHLALSNTQSTQHRFETQGRELDTWIEQAKQTTIQKLELKAALNAIFVVSLLSLFVISHTPY